MMTLANKITLLRAGLSLLMFAFILLPFWWARFAATLIFILAASTDWVDGKIARETNTITPFGAIVDPFVDKILVIAAFFAFVAIRPLNVPIWAVFLILLRELMVSNLRAIAALDGQVMAAERWGKFKTVFQMIMICLGRLLTLIITFTALQSTNMYCLKMAKQRDGPNIPTGHRYMKTKKKYLNLRRRKI